MAMRVAGADHVAFPPFDGLEESVGADIRAYPQSPLVRQDVPLRGFVDDVRTGRLQEVSESG